MKGYFDSVEQLRYQEIEVLSESIAPISQKKNVSCLPHPALWWNTISNLQKSIRRGDSEQARNSAVQLYGADQKRLRRRMCVIALEDICFGDLRLVVSVLGYASLQRHSPSDGGIERCLALIELMVNAVKDRSACELATGSADAPERIASVESAGHLSPHKSAEIYASQEIDPRERCLAGWALSGNLSLHGKRVGARDRATLTAALNEMDIPDVVRFVAIAALRIGGEVSALATIIPILYASMRREDLIVRTNLLPKADIIRGILSPSFDMHTRTGLRALAAFAINCKELQRACSMPGANLRRIVGTVAFRSEGSAVDRGLSSRLGEELHVLNEQATCAAIGFPYEALPEAKRAFLESLSSLNDMRRYYAAQESRSLGIA